MNTARSTLSRESICVTCLSQDRKLFPVKDCKSQALFLNLSERDKLCWECNHFVVKVAAFRIQAVRAQELLASALQDHTNVSKSLSRLACTPASMDISIIQDQHQEPDPLRIDTSTIKTENVKEEHENTFYECPLEDPGNTYNQFNDDFCEEMGDVMLPVFKNREAESVDKACGDEIDDDSLLRVLRKQRKLKGNGGSCGQAKCDDTGGLTNSSLKSLLNKKNTDDIANSSLKSLLSRKSLLIDIPPLCKESTITIELEEIKEIPREKDVTEVDADKQTPTDLDPMYTETIMTEEEMLEWRERKKNAPYYAVNNPALRCEQCIEPFRRKILSVAHMRRHEEDYGAFPCHICGVRSLEESALSAHTAQHYRLLTCKLCGHEWDSPNAMRQHGSVAHGIPVTQWDCDQCERKYPTQEQLKRHVVAHREVPCGVCGARVTQKLMQTHMQRHKAVVTCAVCGRQCNGDRALAYHMKTHDTKVDEAAFCVECNLQFRTMLLYRNHLRYTLKHARTDDMPFKCGVCGKGFLQRIRLILHAESAHGAYKFACDHCGKKFRSRKSRSSHVRRVHRGYGSERNFICDYCGKAFTTKVILRDHINTHTGARPHKCPLCDATFGHKSAIYLHCRYKHNINKKKSDATKVKKRSNAGKGSSR